MDTSVRDRGEQLARSALYGGSFLALLAVVAGVWHAPSPFCWHPILMTLGYAVLMTQGILTGVQARQLPAGEARVQLLKQHMLVQILANLSVLAGLAAIYRNKEILGKPHFVTSHAQMGVGVVLLTAVVAPLLGVLGFRSLGVGRSLSDAAVQRLKSFHRIVGRFVHLCGLVTAAYGVFVFMTGVSFAIAEIGLMSIFSAQCLLLLIGSKGYKQMLP